MNDNGLRVEDLQFGSQNGFVFVGVLSGQAHELKRRLDDLGIGSSLHQDSGAEHAVVHPHTNLSPDRVRNLLAGVGWRKE